MSYLYVMSCFPFAAFKMSLSFNSLIIDVLVWISLGSIYLVVQ